MHTKTTTRPPGPSFLEQWSLGTPAGASGSLELAPRPELNLERFDAKALEIRARDQLIIPARKAATELEIAGLTRIPTGPELVRGPKGYWLVVDHREDPTADAKGRIPIPAAERAKLSALADAGVAPDLIILGHELPADWKPGQLAGPLAPPGKAAVEAEERSLARSRALVSGARSLIKGAAVGTAAVAAAPLLALGGLDPIVLGGVCDSERSVVAWSVLCWWEW